MLYASLRRFVLAATITLAIGNLASGAEPSEGNKVESPVGPAQAKFTISKETTSITEPLRPDGYPDYVAALNNRMSEGVTPENNAAVLLAKVFGPKIIEDSTREETYRQLGIEPLSNDGDYLITQREFIRRWRNERRKDPFLDSEDELDEQFDCAMEKPWSAADFPIVAAWIEANEKPLALAIEATQRPRFFWPLVIAKNEVVPSLIAALLPHTQESRQFAYLLTSRAMLRTAAGDLDGAWQDIQTCHRLARTMGKNFIVESLVGCAIEHMAGSTAISFSHYSKLTAVQARSFQDSLDSGPVMCIADNCDLGDRYMLLDTVAHICREGRMGALFDVISLITALSGKNTPIPTKKDDSWFPLDPFVDWDIPMKMANAWFDRLTAVASIADRRERSRAVQEFDRDVKRLSEDAGNRLRFAIDLIADQSSSRDFWGRKFGEVTLALFLPAIVAPTVAEDRIEVCREMEKVAFALAAYRADHGEYPEKLESIVPRYIAQLPDDTFRPEPGPISYRRDGEAYMLWTVYSNGKDDGGVGYDGRVPAKKGGGDDYILRPVQRVK